MCGVVVCVVMVEDSRRSACVSIDNKGGVGITRCWKEKEGTCLGHSCSCDPFSDRVLRLKAGMFVTHHWIWHVRACRNSSLFTMTVRDMFDILGHYRQCKLICTKMAKRTVEMVNKAKSSNNAPCPTEESTTLPPMYAWNDDRLLPFSRAYFAVQVFLGENAVCLLQVNLKK